LILIEYSAYAVDGLADNNNNKAAAVIIKELRIDARIHERDFISIKCKKEQTSTIICCICGLVYCGKCGKLAMIYDKIYIRHNVYN
jgi:hypothetical protein